MKWRGFLEGIHGCALDISFSAWSWKFLFHEMAGVPGGEGRDAMMQAYWPFSKEEEKQEKRKKKDSNKPQLGRDSSCKETSNIYLSLIHI